MTIDPALSKPRAPAHTLRSFAVRLMEHLVVPTFVLDAQGRVLVWNRACERLTGLRAAEVVGTRDHWRGFYDSPRPCLADLVLQSRSDEIPDLYAERTVSGGGHSGLAAENWCVMPRLGERRYLGIDAGPIYSESGDLLAVVETLRDITVQKEAQLALKALASRDGLTGIANRRSFDETLEQEWRRAKRDGTPLSLLMIDIDHFKQFNDAVGHQAGDDSLRRLAILIHGEMLRPGDLAARYGGEEFAVILPHTPLNGALVVADRMLSAVEALGLRHPTSPTSPQMTVSIGAASSERGQDDTPWNLVARADEALYAAKRAGRCQVQASPVLRMTG